MGSVKFASQADSILVSEIGNRLERYKVSLWAPGRMFASVRGWPFKPLDWPPETVADKVTRRHDPSLWLSQ